MVANKDETKVESKKATALSEDMLKGIWVDGFALYISDDYVILDGIIGPPRMPQNQVAARILFPTRILTDVANYFTQSLKKREESLKKQKEVK